MISFPSGHSTDELYTQQILVDDRLASINWFGPGVVSVEPMGSLKTMWGKLKGK